MKGTTGRYMNLRLTAESVEDIGVYVALHARKYGVMITKTEAINRMIRDCITLMGVTEVDP